MSKLMEDKQYELLKILVEEQNKIIEEHESYSVFGEEDGSGIECQSIVLKKYPDIYFEIYLEDYNIGKKEFCWSYSLEDKENCNRLILYNFDKTKRQSVIAAVNDMIDLLVWRKTRKKVK